MMDIDLELAKLGYGGAISDDHSYCFQDARHKALKEPKHDEAQRETWRLKKQKQRAERPISIKLSNKYRGEPRFWPNEPQRPLHEAEISRPHSEHTKRPVFGCDECRRRAFPGAPLLPRSPR